LIGPAGTQGPLIFVGRLADNISGESLQLGIRSGLRASIQILVTVIEQDKEIARLEGAERQELRE